MNEAEILFKMYKTMGALPIGEYIGVASTGADMRYVVTETSLTVTYVSGEVEHYEDTSSTA
jgi:hypothetical protein